MIWTFLKSLLAGPLDRLLRSIDNGVDNVTERQAIRADAIKEHIRVNGAVRQVAMTSRIFWYVWALFAAPQGLWYAAVMLDSTFSFAWDVPALPVTVQPWADQIFNNIFYSGAGVATANIIGSAITRRK